MLYVLSYKYYLLNFIATIEHHCLRIIQWMIRTLVRSSRYSTNDDKDYRTMNGASQHQPNKDVKEDLNKISLHRLKNIKQY
jgi:hypothetical protein